MQYIKMSKICFRGKIVVLTLNSGKKNDQWKRTYRASVFTIFRVEAAHHLLSSGHTLLNVTPYIFFIIDQPPIRCIAILYQKINFKALSYRLETDRLHYLWRKAALSQDFKVAFSHMDSPSENFLIATERQFIIQLMKFI